MRTRISFVLLGIFAAASVMVAGCKSTEEHAGHSASAGTQPAAVACDKCETTWVKGADYGQGKGAGVTGYSRKGVMPCNDCVTVATKWSTGFKNTLQATSFQHQCKTCGGNVKICEAHRS